MIRRISFTSMIMLLTLSFTISGQAQDNDKIAKFEEAIKKAQAIMGSVINDDKESQADSKSNGFEDSIKELNALCEELTDLLDEMEKQVKKELGFSKQQIKTARPFITRFHDRFSERGDSVVLRSGKDDEWLDDMNEEIMESFDQKTAKELSRWFVRRKKALEACIMKISTAGEKIGREANLWSKQFERKFEGFGKSFGKDIEKWNKQYKRDWEEWGKKFDKDLGAWGKDFSKVWDDASKNYEHDWGKWGKDFGAWGENFGKEWEDWAKDFNYEIVDLSKISEKDFGRFGNEFGKEMQKLSDMLNKTLQPIIIKRDYKNDKTTIEIDNGIKFDEDTLEALNKLCQLHKNDWGSLGDRINKSVKNSMKMSDISKDFLLKKKDLISLQNQMELMNKHIFRVTESLRDILKGKVDVLDNKSRSKLDLLKKDINKLEKDTNDLTAERVKLTVEQKKLEKERAKIRKRASEIKSLKNQIEKLKNEMKKMKEDSETERVLYM